MTEIDNNNMTQILESYDVAIEDLDPEALAKVNDEEGLKLVARVAATNRMLRQHGLAPLLVHSPLAASPNGKLPLAPPPLLPSPASIIAAAKNKAKEPAHLTDEDKAYAATLGIQPEDYAMIKGTYGMFMGLQLDEKAYKAASRLCHSSVAIKLRNDETASKAYIAHKISLHAKKRHPKKKIYPKTKKTVGVVEVDLKKRANRKAKNNNKGDDGVESAIANP